MFFFLNSTRQHIHTLLVYRLGSGLFVLIGTGDIQDIQCLSHPPLQVMEDSDDAEVAQSRQVRRLKAEAGRPGEAAAGGRRFGFLHRGFGFLKDQERTNHD